MRKHFLFLALMAATLFGAQLQAAKQVYTSYNASTKTLTYYYDDNYGTSSRPNSEKYDPTSTTDRLINYYDAITTIVIDASMKDAPLTSMRLMFCGEKDLLKVTSIKDIENLNTANVTDMSWMFGGLHSLESLDLSTFNTAKVTDMACMFNSCNSLKSLNLSSFNTEKVTNMAYMFKNCTALTSLDISKFRFTALANAKEMFKGCSNLTTIYCNTYLSERDMLTQSTDMFTGCTKLKGGNNTAYNSSKTNKEYACPDKSNTPGYFTTKKCIYAEMSIDGTVMYIHYDTDLQYANLDWNADGRGTNNMTTAAKEKITEVNIHSSVANARPTTCRLWFYGLKNLTKIENISNLNTSECTSMRAMFSQCNNLASLDVSGFNTAKVENMSAMFYGCQKLTTLAVSKFTTANVTTMYNMFYGCKALTSLNLSNFDTKNVTDMSYMFAGSSALTMLVLTNFNTAKVTTMNNMFNGCTALQIAYIPFDMSKVANTEYMFRNCSNLTTIYCDGDWSASSKLTSSTDMFVGCTNLKGYFGTAYNAEKIDKSYARPDHGTNQPGYFRAINEVYTYKNGNILYYRYDDQFSSSNANMELYDPIAKPTAARWKDYHDQITKVVIEESMKKAPLTSMRNMFYSNGYALSNVTSIEGLKNLNTENVTNMISMFDNLRSITSLDVSMFKTSKVTTMYDMFYNCRALQEVNIDGLDISKLTSTKAMFMHCTSLTKIYCSGDWNASNILTNSDDMFNNCTALIGGNGTAYSTSYKDKTYARPDENGQKGYFTKTATGIEEIIAEQPANSAAQKVMIDGQIYILRDGKAYNLQGAEVIVP